MTRARVAIKTAYARQWSFAPAPDSGPGGGERCWDYFFFAAAFAGFFAVFFAGAFAAAFASTFFAMGVPPFSGFVYDLPLFFQ